MKVQLDLKNFDLTKKNVGPKDKYLRIGVGALLILLSGMGVIGAWGLLGILPLVTGIVGSCPVYSLLGKSTCPVDRKPVAAGEQPPADTGAAGRSDSGDQNRAA
ncbi:YgaP family membrane protein [Candidatus Methylocalor cossyra]|uniref:Inner membrane protein YgaP-like transmembrane domain-containing protein n=1 Tax=Candidatus Methylocalor cossyra TaxID=3108543 RepID=A0ABP1CCD0_9GAMM